MCFGGIEAVCLGRGRLLTHTRKHLNSLWQGFNQNQAVTGRRLRGTSGLEAGGGNVK